MSKPHLLLTGASSGIGKMMAVMLSKDYTLILNGRDEKRLEATKSACNNTNTLIWKYDLSNTKDLEQELSSFITTSGIEVNYFVHCAGFMKIAPLKMVSLENITNTLNTNAISAMLIMKILMQKKVNNLALKSAVFISSNISNMGAKAFSAYAASKGALDSIMRCLAVELAPNVRVNSVLPGAVKTEMTASMYEDEVLMQRMNATYPLGLGAPEDITEAVMFLLSDNAKWITGQQFTVDGGRTINVTG